MYIKEANVKNRDPTFAECRTIMDKLLNGVNKLPDACKLWAADKECGPAGVCKFQIKTAA